MWENSGRFFGMYGSYWLWLSGRHFVNIYVVFLVTQTANVKVFSQIELIIMALQFVFTE